VSYPPLELGRVAEKRAVQERRRIESYRFGRFPAFDHGVEFCYIDPDDLGLSRRSSPSDSNARSPNVSRSTYVETLRRFRPLSVSHWATRRRAAFSAEPAAWRECKQRKQREPMPLRGASGQNDAINRERWTAE